MEYTKTNWQTGDVITDVLLNKLEEGVRLATPVTVPFAVSDDAVTTDAVFADVAAAVLAGRNVRAELDTGDGVMMLFPLQAYYPKTEPTALIFAGMLDMSGSGEDPSPELLQLIFTVDGSVMAENVRVGVVT